MDNIIKYLITNYLLLCSICWASEIIEDERVSFVTNSDDEFENTVMTLATDVVYFKVKAKEEAMIALMKTPGVLDDYILITLGKAGNTKSSIERYGSTPLEKETPELLSETEERVFWITLEESSIAYGEGEDAGNVDFMLGSISATDALEFTGISFKTGNSVTGHWTLNKYIGHDTFRITSGPLDYNQLWMTSYEKNYATFTVMAGSEARIILSNQMYNIEGDDSHYEITLGAFSNTQSLIRGIVNQNPPSTPLVAVETPQMMKFNEPLTFWVRWDFGVIEVGKGPQIGLEPIMSYAEKENPQKLANITAIGYTTSNGIEGHWRINNFGLNNFRVITPTNGVQSSAWVYAKSKSFEFYLRACDQAAVHLSRDAIKSVAVRDHGYKIEFGYFTYGLGIKKYPSGTTVEQLEGDNFLNCHLKKKKVPTATLR